MCARKGHTSSRRTARTAYQVGVSHLAHIQPQKGHTTQANPKTSSPSKHHLFLAEKNEASSPETDFVLETLCKTLNLVMTLRAFKALRRSTREIFPFEMLKRDSMTNHCNYRIFFAPSSPVVNSPSTITPSPLELYSGLPRFFPSPP